MEEMHSQSSLIRIEFAAHGNGLSSSRARIFLPQLIAILFLQWLMVGWVCGQESDRVVATVNGAPITLRDVDATAINKIFPLQQQIFALRKAALENLISRRVLETQAARKNLSVEDLISQLLGPPVTVAATQVEELYTDNLSAFASMSADEARQKLRLDLETQARLKRYREQLLELRKAVQLESFLEEPRLPVPSAPPFSSIGPANAKVVITEFSDFQCPYCREVQSTIKQVLRQFGNNVRLDFKNLPLEQHAFATVSAQAAYCSGKQGRFWEYHDALFAADGISRDSLDVFAVRSGLNVMLFQDCLASTESRLAVTADIQEARRLGIDSTPTFLINGKLLRGAANFDQFKSIIEHDLKAMRSRSAAQQR
jgi:predicted DsbA family dithiol-disulfide isomerase